MSKRNWYFFHYFWECKVIKRFWSFISQELSNIFNSLIQRDPGYFLLGLPSNEVKLNHLQRKLCDKLLLVARKCFLINWVKDKPPSVTLWYRELFKVIPHERTAAILGGNEGLFLNVWSPLLFICQMICPNC